MRIKKTNIFILNIVRNIFLIRAKVPDSIRGEDIYPYFTSMFTLTHFYYINFVIEHAIQSKA